MKTLISKLTYVFATAAIVVTASQSVSALEYRFKFKVTSSGPDMYACNAGLRTIPLNCDVCYKENSDGTKTPIERPGTCSSTATNCGSRIKCVSRGTNNGETYMNYLTAGLRAWTDHSENQAPRNNVTRMGAANVFQQIVANNVAMDNKIEDLLFELGSEVYSAQYFVDVCYRAPQQSYTAAGISANYNILANVGSTDFISQGITRGDNDRTGLIMQNNSELNRYTQAAGVKVQSYVVCDLQGQGVLQNATNSAGIYNTSDNEADFVIGADGLPMGGLNGSYFNASSLRTLTGDAMDMASLSVINPRFCKVRYVFTETKGLQCNGGNTVFRDWTRKGAEMCTYTVINEPQN
jgi:hypothetical protein